MNIKKIGLTALAGSLVATSVFAGEMSVSGSAAINWEGQEKTTSGNTFRMADSITFSGSGEMDNGMTVNFKTLSQNETIVIGDAWNGSVRNPAWNHVAWRAMYDGKDTNVRFFLNGMPLRDHQYLIYIYI